MSFCIVQGGDCFGAFMQWGLPKGTLKDVWATVAGDEGYLSQQQFVQCLYLMDNAKKVRRSCKQSLWWYASFLVAQASQGRKGSAYSVTFTSTVVPQNLAGSCIICFTAYTPAVTHTCTSVHSY